MSESVVRSPRDSSRYFAYVVAGSSETCCGEGHWTAAEAIAHAGAKRIDRAARESTSPSLTFSALHPTLS